MIFFQLSSFYFPILPQLLLLSQAADFFINNINDKNYVCTSVHLEPWYECQNALLPPNVDLSPPKSGKY